MIGRKLEQELLQEAVEKVSCAYQADQECLGHR